MFYKMQKNSFCLTVFAQDLLNVKTEVSRNLRKFFTQNIQFKTMRFVFCKFDGYLFNGSKRNQGQDESK